MVADFSRIGRSNVARSKAHERRVANLFTEWTGVKFRRRRVEGRDDAVRVVEMVADVISTDGDFIFSIEAKCEVGLSLDALMMNPKGCLFTEWWHQANYDAQLISKDFGRKVYPLLFFKPHPNNDWVAFSKDALRTLMPKRQAVPNCDDVWFPALKFDTYGWLGSIEGNVSHSKKNKKIVAIELDRAIICRWRDFENNIDPMSAFIPGSLKR